MQKLIYYSESDSLIIEKLVTILAREGVSFSKWVLEQARPYVRLHEPGNPQQTLDYIMDKGKAYRAPKHLVCNNFMTRGLPCSKKICPVVYRPGDYEIKMLNCEFQKTII